MLLPLSLIIIKRNSYIKTNELKRKLLNINLLCYALLSRK
jgi:hypothetical protein